MKIEWFGHSCFCITSQTGLKIITDPYESGFRDIINYDPVNESADIVTVSHDHGDHNYVSAVFGNPVVVKGPGTTIVKLVSPPASKKMDFQTGYEKGIGAMLSAISGANIVNFIGSVYGEITHHPVQAILDDDIAGMVGRFIGGVEVNDETLAIDLINEVGPIPGHYLSKEHTRNWWQREQFLRKVADSLTYPEWIKKDKKSCLDYASKRMEEILATHKPTPLTASQEEEIERILEEARTYYRKKGMLE